MGVHFCSGDGLVLLFLGVKPEPWAFPEVSGHLPQESCFAVSLAATALSPLSTPLPLFISLVPCFAHPFLSNPFGWEKHTLAAGRPRDGDCRTHTERSTDEASGLGMSILWANGPLSCRTQEGRGGCRHSQGFRWQKKWCVCLQQDENNTL